uniref:Evasin n=1 Tax=Amblyomma americanum TaxID=6943 RepID=A0A0C9R4U9_AMBAM
MCPSPAFYCLLIWFPFAQSASMHLTLGPGYSIYILETDGGQRTVGCIYKYTDKTKTIEGIRDRKGEECITISEDAYKAMKDGVTYLCPLGLCKGQICEASGLTLNCWKQNTAAATARQLGQGR